MGHVIKGNQTLTALQLLVGLHVYVPHLLTSVCLELAQVMCLLAQLLEVHMCNFPVVSEEHCFLDVISHLWLRQFFCPSIAQHERPVSEFASMSVCLLNFAAESLC